LMSMKHGISRLSHLVGQLLLLSRSEGAASGEQFISVDVSVLCQQTFDMLDHKAKQKQQTLTTQLAPPCLLQGNAALLQSMLRNILDNAIRYSPEGGQVALSCEQQGDKIIIEVSDSGPGIDPELRERVRDRFYRITGSGQQGSGLGLSIVDKIALLHKGQWQLLDSELGGLCVRFEFNLHKSV